MIELSNTRFIRIDGTAVHLLAASDAEARIALKELRHKKREVLHWRRRLQTRAKSIASRDSRRSKNRTAPGAGTATPPRVRLGMNTDKNADMSPNMSAGAYVARSLGAVVKLATGWNPFPGAPLPTTRDSVTSDLATLDEVLLNLQFAILHIEGKLVSGGD